MAPRRVRPRRPGAGKQRATDAVELADVAQRKLRRKVPSVDGALTVHPRTRSVPPARSIGIVDAVAAR